MQAVSSRRPALELNSRRQITCRPAGVASPGSISRSKHPSLQWLIAGDGKLHVGRNQRITGSIRVNTRPVQQRICIRSVHYLLTPRPLWSFNGFGFCFSRSHQLWPSQKQTRGRINLWLRVLHFATALSAGHTLVRYAYQLSLLGWYVLSQD